MEDRKDIDLYAEWTDHMWFSSVDREDSIIPSGAGRSLSVMALGLAGETGEVIEHIKKLIRDSHLDGAELIKELGDVIFYWSRICRFFGFQPSDVIAANVEKLESRKARGTMRGNGDNR